MPKTLVLAEKPSVGRELARVLGCKQKLNGAYAGGQYIVTWALGHLVTLADPEAYDEKYKHWRMETLPMLPDKMKLEVIPETRKQYKIVKDLLLSKEVDKLVIATDAGREGELVARWIIAKSGCKKPIERLWISSQTDKAIKEGFAALKPGKDYESLYAAAQARAEADWLVGLNVTRALTCKFNAQLSAGRVQTPTLALIVRREQEIQSFVPREYHTVRADLGQFFVTWRNQDGQAAIYDKAEAEAIAKRIQGQEFTIINLTAKAQKTPPPALYDLTELQRDANKQYGFSAKETLQIMQRLYETHKALTYPRTDSRYLTDDIAGTLPDRLKAVTGGDFVRITADIRKNGRQMAKSCFNNAKVSDHHAIIPTEQGVILSDLSSDERKIYNLVVRRFLTCFYPDYQYRAIKAELTCGGDHFHAAGREEVDRGWKTVYDIEDEEEAEEQALPPFAKGQSYICKNVQLKRGVTPPPPRYTEATLLSAMENPERFIEDKAMKEYIGGGLGTPATRADIIEKLFSSFYVEKNGRELRPTSKGMQIIGIVPPALKEPLLTAQWEQRLDSISKGGEQKQQFIKEIRDYAAKLVKDVKNSDAVYKHDNLTTHVCPVCGKYMLGVTGKRGKLLVCQDRECGHRENLSMTTRARCPKCHKQLELFGEGEKKTYVCRCGYREKAAAFEKRMKETQKGASKQFVRQYLKNQQTEDEGESAFAKALRQALEKQK